MDREPLLQIDNQQVHDGRQIRIRQGMEDDDLVDAVEELRPELDAQRFGDLALHLLVRARVIRVAAFGETGYVLRADVAGHDQDGVSEVDGSTLAVRQPSVVEDLQEDVEDVRVGLFDLVEQDHLVGPPPNGFGQLAAFLVADVPGRCADKPRHGELLHVLAHVDASHGGFVVEEEFGEGARELRLADTGRSQKEERSDGSARILQSGAGATNGVADGLNRLLLADHAAVEMIFHLDELGRLAFEKLRHRHAGPGRYDLGYVVRRDLFLEELVRTGQGTDRRFLFLEPGL